jgi:ribosomal protein L34
MGLPTVPDTTPGVVPLLHAANANTNNRRNRKNAFEIRMTTVSYLSGSQIAARRKPPSASRLSVGSKGIFTLEGA